MISSKNITKNELKKLFFWLKSLQKPDGGFSEQLNGQSTISCSYYVVRTLVKLSCLDIINRDNLINFLMSVKGKNFGFGNFKGDIPHPQYTSFAIFILKEFGALDRINPKKIIEWLLSHQKTDGGFSNSKNIDSNLNYSYYTMRSLYLLNAINKVNREKLKSFILSLKSKKGGFCENPGGLPGALTTKHAIFLLEDISSEV